jgi:hypothetical protein
MGIFSRLIGGARGGRDPLAEEVDMPCHAIYVHWEFAAPLDVLEFDFTIHEDPGTGVGEYLAPFSGYIDDSQFYFGLQTNIQHPETMQGVGKGLIFSTWWSFSVEDIRVADDGFYQLGTHEGMFVGVRRNYDWSAGDYRVAISRANVEVVNGRELDWFDLTIAPTGPIVGADRPAETGAPTWIGAMRFPRRTPGTPARIQPKAPLFLEVYSEADTWADVARWDLDIMAYGNGVRCPDGKTAYPRYPNNQAMPNANATYDASRQRVRIAFGDGVERTDAPASWR